MKQSLSRSLLAVLPEAADFESGVVDDLFVLADLVEDIERSIRDLAEESGLPSLHFFLLEHLALHDGVASLSALISALNLPKQSATYVVDKLEKDGLVERRRVPTDRRRYEVALTEEGRALVSRDFRPFYGAMLRAMQAVPPTDRRVLLRSLVTFRRALRPSTSPNSS